jgi:hypothetical protein
MRKVGLAVAAVVLAVSAAGCGGSNGQKDKQVPYGAQTCSDWAGHMDSSEHWDAATELLTNAHGADGDGEDGWTPSTGAIKQFESDLGTLCDRGSSGDLLAPLADQLYQSNRAFYSI